MRTRTKLFCSCSNEGEDKPANTCVCPICMGHPGTLPVLNKQAVEWAIMTSLALNCQVDPISKFDRKHYFYPDLPKAYQISQYDKPIGKNGHITIAGAHTSPRVIHINRLHVEEDAAKNQHTRNGKHTLVDYNRGGTPLMEIVSEPELRSPQEAKEYLQELHHIVRYLGVSYADMEKGHLRCDANISLRPLGDAQLYPKTEIKNINSFRSVERALEYEIKRQTELWLEGNPPKSGTTRGWNDEKGLTEEQRTKEEAHDYRYFPDPDLPPLHFAEGEQNPCDEHAVVFDIACIRRRLPELPIQKRSRFVSEYGIGVHEATLLCEEKDIADWAERVFSELQSTVSEVGQTNTESAQSVITTLATNWLINTYIPHLASSNLTPGESKITVENFSELLSLVYHNKINTPTAQIIFKEMAETGIDPSTMMRERGLEQISDTSELEKFVDEAIASNPRAITDFKAGKERALQALVGPIMAKTKGKANPQVLIDIIKKKII